MQRSLDGVCSGYLSSGIDVDSNCLNANLPGIFRVYLAAMDTISAVTYNANNIITGITMSGTSKLFRFKVASYSASFTQPGTVDIEKLLSFASPSLQLNLGKLTTTSRNVLEDLRKNTIGGIIETNNLDYYGFGLDAVDNGQTAGRGARVTAFDASSGRLKNDVAGVSVTLGYDSPYTMREVTVASLAAIVNTV
jgi:hypothetical protein